MPSTHGPTARAQADTFSYGVVLWELITKEQTERGNWRDVVVPDECPAGVEVLLKVGWPLPQLRSGTAVLIKVRFERGLMLGFWLRVGLEMKCGRPMSRLRHGRPLVGRAALCRPPPVVELHCYRCVKVRPRSGHH